jgi:serine/threonine protein kinase
MQMLHTAGIFHRDLRSVNVLMSSENANPIIADFGIAQLEQVSTYSQEFKEQLYYGSKKFYGKLARVNDPKAVDFG